MCIRDRPGIPERNIVLGTSMHEFPPGTEVIYLAFGCFWGAERIMWRLPGVVSTAAGYMGCLLYTSRCV